MILKSHDAEKARLLLDQWRWRVSHSRIESFRELSRKIKRNQEFILNTIRYGLSNVRVGCADKNLDQGNKEKGNGCTHWKSVQVQQESISCHRGAWLSDACQMIKEYEETGKLHEGCAVM